jgi:hypothetical protein
MNFRSSLRSWSFLLLAAVAACGKDTVAPSNNPPAKIDPVTDLKRSAPVGTAVPGGIVVRVSDAEGRAVANAPVAFAVTAGNGATNPRVAVTDANGQASATWTLGTIVGPNQVTASVMGVTSNVKFEATGTAGPVTVISLSPPNPRLLANVDSTRLTAVSLDAFGNPTSPAPTFIVRDPSLISVDANGVVRVLKRGSGTYVVATAGGKSDSVLVTVLAAGQSICTAVATPVALSVGQVVTDVSGQGFCVRSVSAGAEYAIIPFYNSGVPSATIQLEVRGQGLTPLTLPSAPDFRRLPTLNRPASLIPDDAYEMRLRERERTQTISKGIAPRFNTRPSTASAAAIPVIGEIMKLNVNDKDFCDRPDIRTGKVVAITEKAVVVADTANPSGGFSDAEYRSIGVTFDTLIDPVNRAAFGAPTDVDNTGRTMIFFTRAVNELSAAGSGGVVLGYFYRRDLYPKQISATERCEGSNVAEMMYMLVPDTGGVVNGNKRTKEQVLTATMGTVAHEYQHLINAGRRKYVNNAGETFEEPWLDEGLAHMAEDLNFWPAAGRTPRSNIDASIFSDPKGSVAYTTFVNNNTLRYRSYLLRPEIQSPIGFDVFDADLQTRGAAWSFLRYVADRMTPAAETAFWQKLVNSTTAGVPNLTSALGGSPYPLLRDWAISVFLDDNAANVDPRFQQLSWNMRSVTTNGGTSLAFPLLTRTLVDNTTTQVLLAGNGVSFMRFSVPNNQDALLTVTAGGQPLPATVQLAVVRVK